MDTPTMTCTFYDRSTGSDGFLVCESADPESIVFGWFGYDAGKAAPFVAARPGGRAHHRYWFATAGAAVDHVLAGGSVGWITRYASALERHLRELLVPTALSDVVLGDANGREPLARIVRAVIATAVDDSDPALVLEHIRRVAVDALGVSGTE